MSRLCCEVLRLCTVEKSSFPRWLHFSVTFCFFLFFFKFFFFWVEFGSNYAFNIFFFSQHTHPFRPFFSFTYIHIHTTYTITSIFLFFWVHDFFLSSRFRVLLDNFLALEPFYSSFVFIFHFLETYGIFSFSLF